MAQAGKQRLDQILVERGLAPSRERAQALIMAGTVYSGEKRLDKPGASIPAEAPLEIRGAPIPWVSRGGLKLAHALEFFSLSPQDRLCLDIGASTGGFTHVLLEKGAKKVHAVDVGHGQLAWELRNDPRVVVHERCNARHLTAQDIPEPIEFITCDASFISLKTVLPASLMLAAPGAVLVALIKPQFEVGKGKVGKKGVVRDPALHEEVCREIRNWLSQIPGWEVLGLTESPVTGPEGNKEFLIAARFSPPAGP